MAWLRIKSQPSEEERLLQELRKVINEGGQSYLQRVKNRWQGLGASYMPLSGPGTEDLLALSLLSQDIFNQASRRFARSSTRLAWVLTFLTALLVIVAGTDIVLRLCGY
jgi:hypothetical protein